MPGYDEYALRGMELELQELDRKRDSLVREIDRLRGKVGFSPARRSNMTAAAPVVEKRTRNLSVEGRQRLADAQKARWQKKREAEAEAAKAAEAKNHMPRLKKATTPETPAEA